MAKFYVCEDNEGSIIGCELKLRPAKELIADQAGGRIIAMEVPVNVESIRLLLGQLGGYATSQEEIFP